MVFKGCLKNILLKNTGPVLFKILNLSFYAFFSMIIAKCCKCIFGNLNFGYRPKKKAVGKNDLERPREPVSVNYEDIDDNETEVK